MRTKVLLTFLCLATALVGQSAFAALNDFRGTWVNVDPNTRGLTRIVITTSPTPPDDPSVSVHAWGQCHPTDCDWGVVQAHAYCPSVSSNLLLTARSMVAVFTASFKQTTLVMRRAGTQLSVQTFTRFTDNTPRRNYDATYTFRRRPFPLPAFELPHEPPVPLQPSEQ